MKYFPYILLSIIVFFFSGIGFLFWTFDVTHKEARKIECVIESAALKRHTSKSYYNYRWWVDVKSSTGEVYEIDFYGKKNDPEFDVNIPFKTLLVIYTTRSGSQYIYFPDIQKDAPKIP